MMTLKEFMETDAYKEADCVSYVTGGVEIDEEEECLLNDTVGEYHASGGYLEVSLER